VSEVDSGSAVRFGQALPGFLITAPPCVCVPEVIGVLALWISNKKTLKKSIIKYVNNQINKYD